MLIKETLYPQMTPPPVNIMLVFLLYISPKFKRLKRAKTQQLLIYIHLSLGHVAAFKN